MNERTLEQRDEIDRLRESVTLLVMAKATHPFTAALALGEVLCLLLRSAPPEFPAATLQSLRQALHAMIDADGVQIAQTIADIEKRRRGAKRD